MNDVPASALLRARILVVDDEPHGRLALNELLQGPDREVVLASSGAEALRAAAVQDFALVLLDVRMPGMDGIELGSILAERNGVPFLYLSAYGQPDIVQQAASHGALGYLVKPLDISQILPSIETALSRSVERDRLRESEANLNSALAGKRETDLAIGLLMERRRLDRHQAFEMLRSHARSERRTIVDAARELVDSIEKINALPEPVKPARRKRTVKGSRSSPG